MRIASPANIANTCPGASWVQPQPGNTGLTLSSGSVPANTICVYSVDVTLPAAGTYTNTTSSLSTSAGTVAPASATVTAVAAEPVNFTKTWVGGSTGHGVTLAITGSATGAVVGGVSTPAATTPATAVAQPGSVVTVTEAFTNGVASNYDTTFACTSAATNQPLALTGSGLSRNFTMPASGGVNCVVTNTRNPSLTVRKLLAAGGRVRAADQFVLSATGPSNPAPVTTTGAGRLANNFLQILDQVPGSTYSVTETGAGSTVLADYQTTWACTNLNAGGQTPSGQGTTFNVTLAAGDVLSCSFTNTFTRDPKLELEKTADPLSDTNNDGVVGGVGDIVRYRFLVRNTGNLELQNITITDPLPGISLSGGPLASLAPGAQDNSTFTATYVVTQADVNAHRIANQARVTGGRPAETGVSAVTVTDDSNDPTTPAADDPTVVTLFTPNPALSVTKTVDKAGPISSIGEVLNYTVIVANTGNVALSNVTPTDTLQGQPLSLTGPTESLATGAAGGCDRDRADAGVRRYQQ